MIYTSEQIELIDKVFNYYIDYNINRTERRNPTDYLFSKMFKVDREIAKFAINTVCEIGQDLGLLNAHKFGYGNYQLVRMDKILSMNFKDQGGFIKYFSDIDNKNENSQKINISNNYGQVVQSGQNSIISDNLNVIPKSSISHNDNKDKFWISKILFNGWTVTIIGTVIGGLILAYIILKLGWNK